LKGKITIVIFLLVFNFCFSQEHAWVYFTDKPDGNTYLDNPLAMLSQKALNRRIKQNIILDLRDVPIAKSYIDAIINSAGILVKTKSKWLNAIHITGSESDINDLLDLTFVDHVEFAANNLNKNSLSVKLYQEKFEVTDNFNYGSSINQIEMLKGDFLHKQNYTGNSMTIAVLDAGFPNVNSFAAFQRIRDNNQILGGYDFVNRNTNFYSGISHGTSVLSTMAGFVEGELVGTAPDANYYLFITEDASQESPLEESLWVEAAEKADSLGVDIINTSLGYTTFDDSRYDYTYSDMNGTTAFITRGADIAFSRGMIIVNAAGNSGDNPWHYINAPADGFNVLTVGAVDSYENITGFSSYGPTSDGRIKPEVNAKGGGATIIDDSGNVSTGSGTSFSSPILCGVLACFWQAYPDKTNAEIIQIVKESGHLYGAPTDQDGYGIPNFESAFNTLTVNDIINTRFDFYPNPFEDKIQFDFSEDQAEFQIKIFDVLGKNIIVRQVSKQNSWILTENLSSGVYFMRLEHGEESKTFKIIKK